MILQIFLTSVLSAFFAYGYYTIQRPGFFAAFMRPFWKKYFPKSIWEPLFECGVCVASIPGGLSFLYIIFTLKTIEPYWQPLVMLPVILIAMVGITAPLDRFIKMCEKVYGYKTPGSKVGQAAWEYLLPYNSIRQSMVQSFILRWWANEAEIVEIGGYHPEWCNTEKYTAYTHENPFTKEELKKWKGKKYTVLILGLAFDGDLSILDELISGSQETLIEYSKDGESKKQVDLLTAKVETKVYIDYCFGQVVDAPAQCGAADQRQILMLTPNQPATVVEFESKLK